MPDRASITAGHEIGDARVRPIIIGALILAASAGIALLIVYGAFTFFGSRPVEQSNPMSSVKPQVPPTPRLQDNPSIEPQPLPAREDMVLSTYGWSDKNAGTVRVPIDRAMELMLQRGFPTRPAVPTR